MFFSGYVHIFLIKTVNLKKLENSVDACWELRYTDVQSDGTKNYIPLSRVAEGLGPAMPGNQYFYYGAKSYRLNRI